MRRYMLPFMLAGVVSCVNTNTCPVRKIEPKSEKIIVIDKCPKISNGMNKEVKTIDETDGLMVKEVGRDKIVEAVPISLDDQISLEKTRISDGEFQVRYGVEGTVTLNYNSNTLYVIRGFHGYKRYVKYNLKKLLHGVSYISAHKNEYGILIEVVGKSKYAKLQLFFNEKDGFYGTGLYQYEFY